MKVLFSTLIALAFITSTACAEPEDSVYEWGLIYVMSYDNNLDYCAPVINQRLRDGIVNHRVAVSVLMDRLDHDGLKQLLFSKRGEKEVSLETDDITDNIVLSDFLDWSVREMPARKYALIFLNHGGGLEFMCADDYVGEGIGKGHLKASQVGPIIKQWSSQLDHQDSKLSLLFLQQCGRASIENLFNFRSCSEYIVASQINVGAPNTYYTPTVKALCKKTTMSGKDLGTKIMDTDKHYDSYVMVDGGEVGRFESAIEPVCQLFATMDAPTENLKSIKPCFTPGDEKNYDLAQYMTMVFAHNSKKEAPELTAFLDWYHNKLIVEHRFSESGKKKKLDWTGVSTFGILSPKHFRRYTYLPVYNNTLWGQFRKSFVPGLQK